MHKKIRYRLVFNYGGRLNKDGRAPVAVEARQGNKKIHLSSDVVLFPHQWDKGKVVAHDNADKLTVWLVRWMHQIEDIELDALLAGQKMSLTQLKAAVNDSAHRSATLREFTEAFLKNDSSRCETTKRSYRYMVNDLEKEYGRLTVGDVNYDLIVRWRETMRRKNLSENTVKGRLKALRCLMEQARLRDVIDKNPFGNITIGNIGGRQGGLTVSEVRRLERLELSGKEEKVRDLFLLGCYTGLRWGDLATLEEAKIHNGILRKTMHKTHHEVAIPITTLFWGKGQRIIEKYPDISKLSRCACNTTANRILKDIADRAKIRKRVYMHISRKTFGQMLSAIGMPMTDISLMLGHCDLRTTKEHYVFNETTRLAKSVKKLFK